MRSVYVWPKGARLSSFLGATLWLSGATWSCSSSTSPGPHNDRGRPDGSTPSSDAPDEALTLTGAGDIAACDSQGDEATAALLSRIPGALFTAGDNAYYSGTADEFRNCFAPSWGRHLSRMRPAAGNHEYVTREASAYFDYFGAAAGEPGKGYYSYDLGAWHIVVLNSNCEHVGGCDAGSPQEAWFRSDLAAHPSLCSLAIWHFPRFSSGHHGSVEGMRPFFQAAYDLGVDVVLNGHDHHYERFAPQDPSGQADLHRGVREFVVGMGGVNHYPFDHGGPIANSEIRENQTWGVLRLTLHRDRYEWEFVPVDGASFRESGADVCH